MKNVRWLVLVVLLMFCLTVPAFAKKDKGDDKQDAHDRKVEQRRKESNEVRRSREESRRTESRVREERRVREEPRRPQIRDRETRREDRRKDIRVEMKRERNDRRFEEKVRFERRREEPRVQTQERRRVERTNPERERQFEPKRSRRIETSERPRFEQNSKRQTSERPARREMPEVRIGKVRERSYERPAAQRQEVVRKDSRHVREISRDTRERSSKEIRGNVATWNRDGKSFDRRRLPKGAIFFEREKNRHVRARYDRVVERFRTRPSNHFVFIPRPRYGDDYFGHHDGYRYFKRHHHHVTVVTVFYYPYYYSDPDWYGFYHPGYYPSVYSLWGWSPGWIPPRRVYYEPDDYFYRGSYYGSLDYRGMEQAIGDINDAWINGDINLINDHLTNRVDIRISFNGRYSYSLSAEDYYAMTTDAMASMASCSVSFGRPAWISAYEIFVTGRQVFTDPDNEEHILYLSYRLRKLGYNWYIVAFGSSNRAIRNPYR